MSNESYLFRGWCYVLVLDSYKIKKSAIYKADFLFMHKTG
jgi:hypothetical protein